MNPRTRAESVSAVPVAEVSDAETVEILERVLVLWRWQVFPDPNPSRARPARGKRRAILEEGLRAAIAATLRQVADRIERGRVNTPSKRPSVQP